MIGLFPLRLVKGILFWPGIFVCHEQGFSGLLRSYNSGKTVRSSKYSLLGVFKFVMTNDHKCSVMIRGRQTQ